MQSKCSKCGFIINQDAVFCTDCGTRLELPALENVNETNVLADKFIENFTANSEEIKLFAATPAETLVMITDFSEIPMSVLKSDYEDELINISRGSINYVENTFKKAILGGYVIHLSKRQLLKTLPETKTKYYRHIQELSDDWQKMMNEQELDEVAFPDEIVICYDLKQKLRSYLLENEEILGLSNSATDFIEKAIKLLIKRGIFIGYLEEKETKW